MFWGFCGNQMGEKEMKVSVVIPVFNAAKYVEKAVFSALNQPQVGEVILVEDGSRDNSFAVCKLLHESDERVKFYYHSNRENKGAGASRNLGVRYAKYPFVCFLDADDFFLPGRFSLAEQLLNANLKIDGVYGVATYHFYRGNPMYKSDVMDKSSVIGPSREWESTELFNAFFSKKGEWFILGTLTIKKDVFSKVGFFDEELLQTQDTDWLYRVCLKTHLKAGDLSKPVLAIGIHDNNRIHRKKEVAYYRHKLFQKWWPVIMQSEYPKTLRFYLVRSLLDAKVERSEKKSMAKIRKMFYLIKLIIIHPGDFLRLFL